MAWLGGKNSLARPARSEFGRRTERASVAHTQTLERPDTDQETPDPEISIRNLTKRFGAQTVLEDITCDIPKGKITVMLGPSGTGKSVFLKHIMGLLKPDRGEIWIDGQNIPALPERALYKIRRKFGVLFQDGALFGSRNV